MLRQRADQALLLRLCLVDLALTAGCWLLAYYLRCQTGLIPVVNETPPFWWCVRTLPLILLLSIISYYWAGLYQLGERLGLFAEFIRAAKASALLVLLWLAALFYTRDPYESRLASLLFAGP
ncbi:MAG TPA: undecaprenyl-phosphate glucose phosphotransferase, partial [Planctomycetia bacterium]|nr:undecaprenyl-phosphate glucose phosphotransferase [Planctomycetia bacterium]